MRKYFSSRQFICIFVVIFLFVSFVYLLKGKSHQLPAITFSIRHTPTLIWWTPVVSNYYRQRKCGVYSCIFTTNRKLIEDDSKKAFLFYGSDLNYTDLPLPRLSNHIWALLHEESPKNVPYIQYEEVLQHFNITGTFSRYSDFPLTTQYLDNLDLLTTQKYLVPIGEKNKLRIKQKLAPIAYVQSICDTMSGRDDYVTELMKYIEIDSYGKCLNNKQLPAELSTDYLQKIESEEFYKFLARYKFIISYENGICDDYISEKFWRPLIIGSVPIYFGSPTIKDWMPNNNSAILIENFQSPKELANYIKYLDAHDIEYNKFLDHKFVQLNPINNKLLIQTLINREFSKFDNLFESFECFVCKHLQANTNNKLSIADQRHYNCDDLSKIKIFSNLKKDNNNNWESIIKYGKCEANVLNEFLMLNKNFTTKEFQIRMTHYIQNGKCNL